MAMSENQLAVANHNGGKVKRFNTHVILVSGQATPNVLPVMDKTIRPETVILCATGDMRENAGILERYFSRYQIKTRQFDLGSAYDFRALQEKFTELALELMSANSEVGVNLTGGTKLMTIAAQKAFLSDFACFYVNPERNSIQCISQDGAPEYPIAGQLKIGDFFEIHGYRVIASEKKTVSENTERLCRKLLGGYREFGDALGTLNYLAAEAEKDKALTVRNDIPEKSWDLLKLFLDHGAIKYYDDRKIQFCDESGRRFSQGFWLEDWVGLALRELAKKVGLQDYASSITIESAGGVKNEIDAAFLYNNRLYLIECKTANLEGYGKSAPPLYKLDSLHLRPGIFTEMVLVSYSSLDSHGKRRADDLRIRVVEKGNLSGLSTHLANLLKKGEC